MKRPDTKPEWFSGIARYRKQQAGMSLIELMMALGILAVGLCALTNVLLVTMATNNRNSKDTSSTLLAQMVLEQISAQHPNSNASISVTDCAGNTWTVATAGGASPNGTGANLVTSSSSAGYGGIDQTQSASAITSGYAMQYVDCGGVGNTGVATTYDVRWNVMTVNTSYTRLITVSARPLNATALGGISFALPVELRMVAGP